MKTLLNLNSLFLTIYLLLLHTAFTHATDLTFSPATPVVIINQTLTLSVAGAIGQVRWQAFDGTILGEGNQVTYLAPDQVGKDAVTVLDSEGNTGVLKVVITPPNDFSLENAQWEVFMNRSYINALLLSEDGKTLWVGTNGGLEKRDAQTGDVQQIFLNTDGLPDNSVNALIGDNQDGLWVGTGKGLAHYTAQGEWQIFNTENSVLQDNHISALLSDGTGGLWIGTKMAQIVQREITGQWKEFEIDLRYFNDNYIRTMLLDDHGELWLGTDYDGLVHYKITGQKEVFHPNNSELPGSFVTALQSDNGGGIWIGTKDTGLAHRSILNQWTIFNFDNSKLPSSSVQTLLLDSKNGLWIGTSKGLAYRDVDGQWEVFNTDNSDLSSNFITTLLEDGGGRLWIGTNNGLVYRDSVSQWQAFKNSNELPDNYVSTLLSDNHDGLWIGTFHGGVAHLDATGQWEVFNTANSELPDNMVLSLCLDNRNGLWVGTKEGGLAYRDSIGQWKVSDTSNSELPDNTVTALLLDDSDGLWIGTYNGLVHHKATDQWEVFYPYKLGVSTNSVFSLLLDGKGGLWVGTGYGGLMHHDTTGHWEVFNPDDSRLPPYSIVAMLLDEHKGLWIGTGRGLLYHDTAVGQWEVFDTQNSQLPHNWIESLQWDGSGGIWVGTDGGLAHRDIKGQWKTFTTEHSDLPENLIYALLSDNKGGLWIGNNGGGLAHLTFSRQTELCTQSQIDSATCQAIQQGQHAAIIVAAGGAQDTNTLWESTETITTRIYRTFYRRGFAKSNLYYLSPKTWADFDGDGRNDRINRLSEDRNLTLDDLQQAFTWAKGLGKLDQPMYFFFMDHGGEGKLQLSPGLDLPAAELKTMLNDYQTATGNTMVVVIEACHSGSLIPILSAPNRAVITSAKDSEKAYFFEKKGFSRFLADYLLKGASFGEAFTLAGRDQEKLLGKNLNLQTAGEAGLTPQTPQLDDNQDGTFTTDDGNWLKQIYVNGKFTTADATLAVENQTTATTLTVGQPITLQAKATLTQGTVKRVWAVIRPPAIAQILDTNGTPILAFPRLNLFPSSETPDVWQATWDDAVYNGNYLITFYAEDNEKNIASSDQDTVLTVTGGINPPASAQVQIQLEKDRYQRGEPFKATLTEELGWGYDLYAAVRFPDGQNFMTLKNTNELRLLNEAKPWYAPRQPHSPLTLFELNLPADLPTGEYCLYGILSPEQNDVFEAKGLWVMDKKCFEIF